MTPRVWIAASTPLLLAGACDSGQSALTGIGEPIQITNGQFISGNLPGTAPPPSDGGVVAAAEDAGPPDSGPSEPLEITPRAASPPTASKQAPRGFRSRAT